MAWRPLLALVLVGALVPLASAQSIPVLVKRVDEGHLAADVDRPAVAEFDLLNLHEGDDVFVSVQSVGPAGWDVTVEPSEFFLGPRGAGGSNLVHVNVTFQPRSSPRYEQEFAVTFALIQPSTGGVAKVEETIRVASLAPPLVLDFFPNPLPSPLDNAYGTFLLDVAFWIGVALVSIFLGDTVVRVLTTHASNAVTREILTKLRRPVFLFVFFVGLSRSFLVLPRNFFTDAIVKTLVAVGVGIFGLYVLYRILDSALLYYQREVAPRTATRVDDVLVPLLRKVGIVVLYAMGVVTVLRTLDWDPTVIFAGAGIAGLVVAFAAQDTFSNLFSGVFLLLDQPFREGDDIQLETGEITRVETIGLRTTRLYHMRNHERIVVPNNQLATRRIVNLSAPDGRYWMMVDIGAAYGEDPERVKGVILSTLDADPRIITTEEDWKPLVLFTKFGESSLDFLARFAVHDYRDRHAAASDLRFRLKKAFDEAGIEIPFPQRTVWVREWPPLEGAASTRAGQPSGP